MRRPFPRGLMLLLLACAAGAAPARRAAPADSERGLKAELFDDEKFGHKVKERIDPEIDFMFGDGAADPDMPADHFSIRWTGWICPRGPVTCKLVAKVDDTMNVWIDGRPVIESRKKKEAVVNLTGKPQ